MDWNLTKTGVTGPDGKVTYYDNQLDALKAQSQAAAAAGLAQPTQTLTNSILPSEAMPTYTQPASAPSTVPATIAAPATDTPGTLTAITSAPPIDLPDTPAPPTPPVDQTPAMVASSPDTPSPAPTLVDGTPTGSMDMSRPGFLKASAGGINSPALTTKGAILSGLLSTALGGVAGAGQRTIGQGYEKAITLPIDIRRQSAMADQAQAQAALENANVAEIPANAEAKRAMQGADLNLKNAEATFYQQGKNFGTPEARSAFVKQNPQYFKSDEEKSNYVIFGSKEKQVPADSFQARQTQLLQIHQLYPKDQWMSPEQEQAFLTTGKLNLPKESNPTAATLAVQAANGDKQAAHALNLYASATRPNYTPGNQQNAADIVTGLDANSASALGTAMSQVANDPVKGLARLDAMAADPRATPEQKQAIMRARIHLQAQAGHPKTNAASQFLTGIGVTTPTPAAQ